MPATEPLLFVIWYRAPGKGQRWRKAGRASTHAEAVAMIGGAGDWHITPLFDADLAADGPSLFDDDGDPRWLPEWSQEPGGAVGVRVELARA
jgi:hypothetical protein